MADIDGLRAAESWGKWREHIMNKNISTHWLVGVMVIGAIVTGCGNKHAESKNDTNVIELLNVMIFTSCPLFSFQ